jgi:hypothetical protein
MTASDICRSREAQLKAGMRQSRVLSAHWILPILFFIGMWAGNVQAFNSATHGSITDTVTWVGIVDSSGNTLQFSPYATSEIESANVFTDASFAATLHFDDEA